MNNNGSGGFKGGGWVMGLDWKRDWRDWPFMVHTHVCKAVDKYMRERVSHGQMDKGSMKRTRGTRLRRAIEADACMYMYAGRKYLGT